jgi:hypothetical protein
MGAGLLAVKSPRNSDQPKEKVRRRRLILGRSLDQLRNRYVSREDFRNLEVGHVVEISDPTGTCISLVSKTAPAPATRPSASASGPCRSEQACLSYCSCTPLAYVADELLPVSSSDIPSSRGTRRLLGRWRQASGNKQHMRLHAILHRVKGVFGQPLAAPSKVLKWCEACGKPFQPTWG